MTPVDQRTETDCLRACIASILSLSYEEVPDFEPGQDQSARLDAWLAERSMYRAVLSAWSWGSWVPGGYHIMAGPAVGGALCHAVVGYRGEMVHDPHPSRLGLAEVETWTLIVVEDLRLIRPAGDVVEVDVDVVELDDHRPHWTGRAFCLNCGDIWTAVKAIGPTEYLPPFGMVCPTCGGTRTVGMHLDRPYGEEGVRHD